MKTLVKKMSSLGVLKIEMVIGAIVMLAAMIVPAVGFAAIDPTLLENPYVLGVVIGVAVIFGLLAYFLFIRPYFIYRKLPEVLAETDGVNVYFHGTKQAVIPLSAFADAVVTYQLPFIYSGEFFAALLAYLVSEKYGDLIVDVPEYGSFRLRFVSGVQAAADGLLSFLCEATADTED